MSYQYVVTAQHPTNVTHSLTANFTAADELNLIIVKCTRIEIHSISSEGLIPEFDVGVYGRIATIDKFRPQDSERDFLFVTTDRLQFCVLPARCASRPP